MKAFIEQIATGHKAYSFAGFYFKERPDMLCLSNKPNYWIFSLFTGYKQLGTFCVSRPHNFHEREYVEIELGDEKQIISVMKVKS